MIDFNELLGKEDNEYLFGVYKAKKGIVRCESKGCFSGATFKTKNKVFCHEHARRSGNPFQIINVPDKRVIYGDN